MPIKILMPALSPTMTEGNLVRWLKKEGEEVRAGQVLAEIETDKATMEVEAVDEGILAKILIPAGSDAVAVNTPIALLLEEDEDPKTLEGNDFQPSSPSAQQTDITAVAGPQEITPVGPSSALLSQPLGIERVFASPLARRLAQEKDIDLMSITGSGPRGRIVKADIEKTLLSSVSSRENALPTSAAEAFVDVPLTSMRKVIAKRLTESKQQIPHFYLSVSCELDKLLALRTDLNARLQQEKLSVNDFVIRAVALALMKVPEANTSWQETHIRQYQEAHVAVAVAMENGLVTPVIRHAQNKSLVALSQEMKALATKARDGKLRPEEFQGGTFTISNLGMYGIDNFAAIINPPQACILAVGAGKPQPVVKEGQLGIANLMTCTLSVDHRAVDGAVGSRFLQAFKELIEDPLRLLI